MADFTRRSTANEMMDDFSLESEIINPIMDELEVVNKFLGGYSVFFNACNRLHIKNGMTISDWGCGGGDSLRVIARWARKQKLKLEFIGIDATASAIEYARQKSATYPEVSFIHSDVFNPEIRANHFDVVISSLFTHHFKDEQWILLIQKMYESARYAVIINDLHRHWFAYHAIGILTRLFSKSEMVKHDSKASVLRSFKLKELETMLKKTGIVNYSIKWMWAFRWQIILYKS